MPETPDLIDLIKTRAKEYFAGARGSHGWDHVLRVYGLCERIGPKENCDMTVLLAAALLHDIGRRDCDMAGGGGRHELVGGEIARDILNETGAGVEFAERVVHCIVTHRFRGGADPKSAEAKALFDADKLDSIGSVGIGRAFQFAGEIGARLDNPGIDPARVTPYGPEDTARYEYTTKLQHIISRMYTKTGRKMAESRDEFMREFFKRLDDEIKCVR